MEQNKGGFILEMTESLQIDLRKEKQGGVILRGGLMNTPDLTELERFCEVLWIL